MRVSHAESKQSRKGTDLENGIDCDSCAIAPLSKLGGKGAFASTADIGRGMVENTRKQQQTSIPLSRIHIGIAYTHIVVKAENSRAILFRDCRYIEKFCIFDREGVYHIPELGGQVEEGK